jgi:hypothetical protein
VRLRDRASESAHFQGDDAETLALDASEDLTDETARHTIGLDQDQGSLGHVHSTHSLDDFSSLLTST